MRDNEYEIVESVEEERDERGGVGAWLGAHLAGVGAVCASLALVGTAAAFITRTGTHTTGTFTYGDVAIKLYDANNLSASGNTSNTDYSSIMPNEQFDYQPTIKVAASSSEGAYLYAKVSIPKGMNHRTTTENRDQLDTSNITTLFTTDTGIGTEATSTAIAKSTFDNTDGAGWLEIESARNVSGDVEERLYAYVKESGGSYVLCPVTNDQHVTLFSAFKYDATANEKPRKATDSTALVDNTTQIKVEAYAIQVENLDLGTGGSVANGKVLTKDAKAAENKTNASPTEVWTTYGDLMSGTTNGQKNGAPSSVVGITQSAVRS